MGTIKPTILLTIVHNMHTLNMQKQWFCHAKSTGFEAKKHHF